MHLDRTFAQRTGSAKVSQKVKSPSVGHMIDCRPAWNKCRLNHCLECISSFNTHLSSSRHVYRTVWNYLRPNERPETWWQTTADQRRALVRDTGCWTAPALHQCLLKSAPHHIYTTTGWAKKCHSSGIGVSSLVKTHYICDFVYSRTSFINSTNVLLHLPM